jgi:chromosome segregation ATPase
VAPDKFFMFWYQNSITRFATMKDRERFEYVAEMYGLKETQERWERAKTERKLAQEDFDRAKINLDKEKDQVVIAEKRYNMWKLWNRLRLEGVLLKRKYLIEKGRLLDFQIGKLMEKLEQLSVQQQEQERQMCSKKEEITILTNEYERELEKRKELEEEKRTETAKRDELNHLLERLRQERDELDKETREIKERHRYVRPAELLQQLSKDLERDLSDIQTQLAAMNDEQETVEQEIREGNQELGKRKVHLRQLQEVVDEWNAYFQYADSMEVLEKREQEVEKEFSKARHELERYREEIQAWNAEKQELEQNKVLKHPLQVERLKYYKQKQLNVYPFGELFEIHPNQSNEQVEYLLSSIKYTLFICGPLHEAPTSLLHVSLMDERIKKRDQGLFRKKLPGKPLHHFVQWNQIVYDLLTAKEREYLANWVDQIHVITPDMESLYAERGESYLLDGQLHGPMGQRGSFAQGAAIGEKAWQERLVWLEEQLVSSQQKLMQLLEAEETAKEHWHACRDARVKHEERLTHLPIKDRERKNTAEQLEYLTQQLKQWEEQKKELGEEIKHHLEQRKEKQLQWEEVKEELDIHRQLGEMAVKLDRLRQVRKDMEEKGRERDHKTYHINDVDRSIQLCSDKMDRARQSQLTLNQEMNYTSGVLQKIEDDQEFLRREKNGFRVEEEKRKAEETEFTTTYSEFIPILADYEPEPFETVSELRLKSWEDDGRRKLDEAEAMPVDEWAEEKYQAIRDSFKKAQQETEAAEELFLKLLSEEEALRDHFRKTVYDRYQRINHHFQDYIQRIGFRGKIEQIEPDEDDPRRQHYEWRIYIATKTGHDLEYLRPTESIRQKIVSAPSGGETLLGMIACLILS